MVVSLSAQPTASESSVSEDILLPFIPISLFLCIAWTIKAIVDARVRRQLVSSNVSQELIRSIIEGDETRRRHASLRWGIIFMTLAIGFIVIEAAGWKEVTPGVIAVLLGAIGLGNLAYYAMTRKLAI